MILFGIPKTPSKELKISMDYVMDLSNDESSLMDEEIREDGVVSKRQLHPVDWRFGGWVCQPSLGGSGLWLLGVDNVILKHQIYSSSQLFWQGVNYHRPSH